MDTDKRMWIWRSFSKEGIAPPSNPKCRHPRHSYGCLPWTKLWQLIIG
jgi:hypothetical protein